MDLKLAGKMAIVNGASQGMGLAIARVLAQEGVNLVVSARKAAPLAEAADRIEAEMGVRVVRVEADIRKSEDCARIVEVARREYGVVDVLVNNDGAPPLGPSLDFDDIAWQKAMEQNFFSVLRMCRGVVPMMRPRGGGGILNIAALSVLQPLPGFGLSVASWSGVIGLAKTLSIELGPDNINVNTLCPGLIETPRLQKVVDQSGGPMDSLTREVPLGRYGKAEEIADFVAFVVSPKGRYLTGSTFHFDGGLRKALL